jgi:hypothetical protein
MLNGGQDAQAELIAIVHIFDPLARCNNATEYRSARRKKYRKTE